MLKVLCLVVGCVHMRRSLASYPVENHVLSAIHSILSEISTVNSNRSHRNQHLTQLESNRFKSALTVIARCEGQSRNFYFIFFHFFITYMCTRNESSSRLLQFRCCGCYHLKQTPIEKQPSVVHHHHQKFV